VKLLIEHKAPVNATGRVIAATKQTHIRRRL
jgi:hypothetical protein